MKRLCAALLAVAMLTAWTGKTLAADFEWRMATIDRETGIYWKTIAAKYVELVSKLTNGRMKITPLPWQT